MDTGGAPSQKISNGKLMFSLLIVRRSCWTNGQVAGDWGRHDDHVISL